MSQLMLVDRGDHAVEPATAIVPALPAPPDDR